MASLFEITSICKGGGYRYCRTEPKHPKANTKGLYPLHRVRMENKLGRLLEPGEDVHHDDEDKTNDAPENLGVLDHGKHTSLHRAAQMAAHPSLPLTTPRGPKRTRDATPIS